MPLYDLSMTLQRPAAYHLTCRYRYPAAAGVGAATGPQHGLLRIALRTSFAEQHEAPWYECLDEDRRYRRKLSTAAGAGLWHKFRDLVSGCGHGPAMTRLRSRSSNRAARVWPGCRPVGQSRCWLVMTPRPRPGRSGPTARPTPPSC